MIFTKEPKWQKEIIDRISASTGLNVRVVREIAYYPLLFLKKEMADDYSERPVRVRKLGVWTLKKNSGKIKVLRENAEKLKAKADVLYKLLHTRKKDKFESPERFIRYINYMVGQRNHSLIRTYVKVANRLGVTI